MASAGDGQAEWIVSFLDDDYAIPPVYVGQGGPPGKCAYRRSAGHMWGRCWILGGVRTLDMLASADEGPMLLAAGRSILGRLPAFVLTGRAVQVPALD